MTTLVVPYAGASGKTRIEAPRHIRHELSLAMLADVLAAASPVGDVLVVTGDEEGRALARAAGADAVRDPGGGQGPAVAAALAGARGRALVVNADLPCVLTADLRALEAGTPGHGLALAEARDGTTNALGLSDGSLFRPLYGPGSAGRFGALGVETVRVTLPNLADDVDTIADLERLHARCGPRTQAVLAGLTAEMAR